MGIFKSPFEKVLEKCTSNLLLEPDWEGMLQLCDFIRGNDIKPREAVALIKENGCQITLPVEFKLFRINF